MICLYGNCLAGDGSRLTPDDAGSRRDLGPAGCGLEHRRSWWRVAARDLGLWFPRFEQRIDPGHYLKRIGDVHHIGLAACPAAVCVKTDGSPLGDESPTHRVRLLAMTTGGEPLGVARRRTGLADLVQMRQEGQHRLIFTSLAVGLLVRQ